MEREVTGGLLRSEGWTLYRRLFVTLVMIVVLLLATGLRLHELNADSLWGDEIFEARNAQRDLISILKGGSFANRPILILTHVFMLFGGEEFVVRFSYSAMGILGVAMVYVLGKTLFDDTTGIVAALLLAISPFHIRYSQEARSYSLTVLLVLISCYCLYLALQNNQVKYWLGFAVATALSLNNNPSTASVLVSEIVFATLVLLAHRFNHPAAQHYQSDGGKLSDQEPPSRSRASLNRLSSSKEIMMILSLFLGMVLFLISSGSWIAYLSRIGVSGSDADTVNDTPVLQPSVPVLLDLFGQFGAGEGVALYLFLGAFALGLVVCVSERRWRQLLLAVVWIVPPFLILPQVSASAFFGARHLIFILPIYLLFVAAGIVGIGRLVGRVANRLLGTKTTVWRVVVLVFALGVFVWVSIEPLQAYYRRQKHDWRGAAAFLQEHTGPGDLIYQVSVSPKEVLPYYLDDYLAGGDVELVNFRQVDKDDLPADVWWVFFLVQTKERLAPQAELKPLVGPEFEIYEFHHVAVVHRRESIVDEASFSQVAAKLFLVQALLDKPQRLKWYRDLLALAYRSVGAPRTSLIECLPESSDPVNYLETAQGKVEQGKSQQAVDSVLKSLALHEVLYPTVEELDSSVTQALWALIDSVDEACAGSFYSRAVDALLLAVEADPDDAGSWGDLAKAFSEIGLHQEAISAYRRALVLAPDHVGWNVELGKAYRNSGLPEEAIAQLEQAVALAPDAPWPRRVLADTYRLSGHLDQAVAAYQKVLAMDPDDHIAWFNLALTYEAQGSISEAINGFKRVTELPEANQFAERAWKRLQEYQNEN